MDSLIFFGKYLKLFGLKNHPNTNTNTIRFEEKKPNTNTNTIRFEKIAWIRIQILFGLKKSSEYEYEYEYYSVWKITQIRIRILFGLIKSPEYEYEY